MKTSDYLRYDALGLAELIAKKQVTSAEVVSVALEQLAKINPKLNAVILDLGQNAKQQAAAPASSGPFGGVPFLIKDLFEPLQGTVTSSGSRLFAHAKADQDSALVSSYKRAGLVVIGKTNTPEFGLEPVTEPELFGPTLNPWDTTRTPGGSSGGSAAAVASGIVPAAHASDGGGSIRIPASCCGLFGLKPSRGRVSMAPASEGWGGLAVRHALTRTVRDSAALLDAVCEPVPGDPYFLVPPQTSFLEQTKRAPGRLRIGFSTGALSHGNAIDPECANAVHQAAKLCESLGHDVEEAELSGNMKSALDAFMPIASANIAAMLESVERTRGSAISRGEIDLVSEFYRQLGVNVSGAQHVQAIQAVHAYARQVAVFFTKYDVFLCATLGSLPLKIGELRGNPLDLGGYAGRLSAFSPNTLAFNMTGQPAMSVPLSMSASGLPVGVQFVGRMAEEALLFRLAAQLETASPWPGLAPMLS